MDTEAMAWAQNLADQLEASPFGHPVPDVVTNPGVD